jgi:peptidylprolyl isomerase
MAAKPGDKVRVHYKGTLDDGTQFDCSEGRDPIEFTLGLGEVIQGFDDAVTGLEVGETRTVTIPPEEAYGRRNDELVQHVSLEDFAEPPQPGWEVQLVAPDGTPLPGTVAAIEGDDVTLDFNHPLAGEALTFEIELHEIVE